LSWQEKNPPIAEGLNNVMETANQLAKGV
jgi:hypothetical protein